MKKYRVQVVMSYWNTIEVEADSAAEAGDTAFDLFDEKCMTQGEGEVMYVEEITTEGEVI
jgi:hypothetical protein